MTTATKREIRNLKLFTGNANPELAQEIRQLTSTFGRCAPLTEAAACDKL